VGEDGLELCDVGDWKQIWGTFDATQAVVGEELWDGPLN